jgi:hypothetical protein
VTSTGAPITLPTRREELAELVHRHVVREESRLMVRRTIWLLAWYYLQGYRRFEEFNPSSGALLPHYLDEKGDLEFQHQELLHMCNQVVGRVMNMDVRPRVVSEGMSLTGLRERAISQVIADSVVSTDQLLAVQERFAWTYTALGSCGLQGHIVDHPTVGLTADIEVVHPREVMPFPSLGQDYTRQAGICRTRMVPLSYLKDLYGRRISDNLGDMEWYEVDPGQAYVDDSGPGDTAGPSASIWPDSSGSARTAGGSKGSRGEAFGWAKITELWLDGPRNTVSRYVITSGKYVIEDQDLSQLEVFCPLGFARMFNNGTFHGAGMFDMLFSTHRQMEKMLKTLINNVVNTDRYGVLVLPQGQFNRNQVLEDVGEGLKVMFWEPDPTVEGFTPFPIAPFNTGNVPADIARLMREVMQGMSPIRDLVAEKGRVDSAQGLQFLDEQIQRALTSPTSGVQRVFGELYRGVVQKSVSFLTISRRPLHVDKLTLDLAGAVIDPESNEVEFTQNPLPSVSRLHFTIREVSPRSEAARKAEAMELAKMGMVADPDEFRLFALQEGLDFAMWMEAEKASYETAVRNIILLYGDGRSPGQILVTPHIVRPEFQLRILDSFMSGPRMSVASPEVMDAFRLYRLQLITYLGVMLPEAVPNPEDSAMLRQATGALAPG